MDRKMLNAERQINSFSIPFAQVAEHRNCKPVFAPVKFIILQCHGSEVLTTDVSSEFTQDERSFSFEA